MRLKQLGVNEGLSHSDVTSIVQDQEGYLWLGTNNGLNRYDGNKIRVFKSSPSDTSGLPESRISSLHADSRGLLWIGMRSKGLCVYNKRTETFRKVALPGIGPGKAAFVSAIKEDGNGVIWAVVRGRGIFLLERDRGRINTIKHIGADQGLPSVHSIVFLSENRALIASGRGLFSY
ncbi:MAG TPA: two-component regulator propeller domain-containing protein, partial [Anseongella sp.]|nr:two-component regulator propeller domain-containing protein [Anseongella sp.]